MEAAHGHDDHVEPSDDKHIDRSKDPRIVGEAQAPIRAISTAFFILGLLVVIFVGMDALKSWRAHTTEERKKDSENEQKAQQAARQTYITERNAALANAPATDFDRRLRFEHVTPTEVDINYPAIIAWVGPGGILVKWPGTDEYVRYQPGKAKPPQGARTTGRFGFAPVDKDNPATVQVFEKVWR